MVEEVKAGLPAIYDHGLNPEVEMETDDIEGILNSEAFRAAIEEGNLAATRIRSRVKALWRDWLGVGHSLYYLHATAMQVTHANDVNDGRYKEKLGALMSHTQFDDLLDKWGRSRLIWLMEREEAVTSWWSLLSTRDQARWCHPSTVYKEFTSKKKEKKPKGAKAEEGGDATSEELADTLGVILAKITRDADENVREIAKAVGKLELTLAEQQTLLTKMVAGLDAIANKEG